MTEDTTAQLREQIEAALFPPVRKGQEAWEAVADAVMLVVLAQVEAAKATARREALADAAFVMHRAAEIWRQEDPSNPDRPRNLRTYGEAARVLDKWSEDPSRMDGHLRHRASAQGAAAPAECPSCEDVNLQGATDYQGCPVHDVQRPGAQSSGHEFVDNLAQPGTCAVNVIDGMEFYRCGMYEHAAIHAQRDPGQPGEQGTAGETTDG